MRIPSWLNNSSLVRAANVLVVLAGLYVVGFQLHFVWGVGHWMAIQWATGPLLLSFAAGAAIERARRESIIRTVLTEFAMRLLGSKEDSPLVIAAQEHAARIVADRKRAAAEPEVKNGCE